jgi:hypothetical protein
MNNMDQQLQEYHNTKWTCPCCSSNRASQPLAINAAAIVVAVCALPSFAAAFKKINIALTPGNCSLRTCAGCKKNAANAVKWANQTSLQSCYYISGHLISSSGSKAIATNGETLSAATCTQDQTQIKLVSLLVSKV